MKARSYLAEHGLAIAGSRGKFSFKAIKALNEAMAEGVEFEDWNENGRISKDAQAVSDVRTVKVKPTQTAAKPRTRKTNDFNAMQIIDSFGIKMVIEYCAAGHVLLRCDCEVIRAPSHLNAISTELIMRKK